MTTKAETKAIHEPGECDDCDLMRIVERARDDGEHPMQVLTRVAAACMMVYPGLVDVALESVAATAKDEVMH